MKGRREKRGGKNHRVSIQNACLAFPHPSLLTLSLSLSHLSSSSSVSTAHASRPPVIVCEFGREREKKEVRIPKREARKKKAAKKKSHIPLSPSSPPRPGRCSRRSRAPTRRASTRRPRVGGEQRCLRQGTCASSGKLTFFMFFFQSPNFFFFSLSNSLATTESLSQFRTGASRSAREERDDRSARSS